MTTQRNSIDIGKLLIQAQVAYFVVTLGANLFAVMGLYLLTIQFLTPEEQTYLNAGGDSAQILNFLSFLVPIAFMIWYFYPTKNQILSVDKKLNLKLLYLLWSASF